MLNRGRVRSRFLGAGLGAWLLGGVVWGDIKSPHFCGAIDCVENEDCSLSSGLFVILGGSGVATTGVLVGVVLVMTTTGALFGVFFRVAMAFVVVVVAMALVIFGVTTTGVLSGVVLIVTTTGVLVGIFFGVTAAFVVFGVAMALMVFGVAATRIVVLVATAGVIIRGVFGVTTTGVLSGVVLVMTTTGVLFGIFFGVTAALVVVFVAMALVIFGVTTTGVLSGVVLIVTTTGVLVGIFFGVTAAFVVFGVAMALMVFGVAATRIVVLVATAGVIIRGVFGVTTTGVLSGIFFGVAAALVVFIMTMALVVFGIAATRIVVLVATTRVLVGVVLAVATTAAGLGCFGKEGLEVGATADEDFAHHEGAEEGDSATKQNVAHIVGANDDTAKGNQTRIENGEAIEQCLDPALVALGRKVRQGKQGVDHACGEGVTAGERFAVVAGKNDIEGIFQQVAFAVDDVPGGVVGEIAQIVHSTEAHTADGRFDEVHHEVASHRANNGKYPPNHTAVRFGIDTLPQGDDTASKPQAHHSAEGADIGGGSKLFGCVDVFAVVRGIELGTDELGGVFEQIVQNEVATHGSAHYGKESQPFEFVISSPKGPKENGTGYHDHTEHGRRANGLEE